MAFNLPHTQSHLGARLLWKLRDRHTGLCKGHPHTLPPAPLAVCFPACQN